MGGHPIKILVADPDEAYRTKVQQILREHFKHVDEAGNGPQVLKMCDRNDYALVIVENHLPGILGIEVVRRLEQKFPKMRRILTSSEDTDPVIESALEYGIIDRFLEKPLKASLLVWESEYLLGIGSEPPPLHEDDEDEMVEDFRSSPDAPSSLS